MSGKIITKFWFDSLSIKHDTIPCPHCLTPMWLGSPNLEDHEKDRPIECTCRNEKCQNFSSYIFLKNYYNEFKFVLKRHKDGYKYSKKVVNFAKEIVISMGLR